MRSACIPILFFFFNDTATTEIYTLSLHDALPIFEEQRLILRRAVPGDDLRVRAGPLGGREHRPELAHHQRSEEHTSELQSPCNLVCRLLLEKKKNIKLRISGYGGDMSYRRSAERA